MNSYLKEFENHLNQITAEVLDDFDARPEDDLLLPTTAKLLKLQQTKLKYYVC